MTPENRYAVDITVESRYVEEQSAPMDGVFAFAYTITIKVGLVWIDYCAAIVIHV